MPLNPAISLQAQAPDVYGAVQEGVQNSQNNFLNRLKTQYLPQQMQAQTQQAQMGMQKDQLELQNAKLAQAKQHLDIIGNLLGSATDQQTYDVARQKAASLGLDVSNEPQAYDPNYVKSQMMATLDAKDRVNLAMTQSLRNIQMGRLGLGQNSLDERIQHDQAIETGEGRSANTGPRIPLGAPTDVLPPPSVSGGTTLPPPDFSKIGPTSPISVTPSRGAPVPTQAMNQAPVVMSKLSGMDYIKARSQNNPGTANQILAMANGQQPIPTSRGKSQNPIVAELNQAFPGTSDARHKAYMDFFGGGKSQQSINSLQTAIGHAGDLLDAINTLHADSSVDNPYLNPVSNYVSSKIQGTDKVGNYRTIVQPLAQEIEKVYSGTGGGALASLQEAMGNIGNPNATKKQQLGALNTMVHLLSSKVNAYQDQYKASMQGAPSPTPLVTITPERQATIDKIKQAAVATGASSAKGVSTIPHDAIDAELQKRGVK